MGCKVQAFESCNCLWQWFGRFVDFSHSPLAHAVILYGWFWDSCWIIVASGNGGLVKEPSQKMTQHFRNKACCRTKSWCTFGQISPLHRFYHHSICPSNRPFSETAVPWAGPSRGSDDDVQRTHTVIPLELSGWQLQRVWLTQMWRGSCKNFIKNRGWMYEHIYETCLNMWLV